MGKSFWEYDMGPCTRCGKRETCQDRLIIRLAIRQLTVDLEKDGTGASGLIVVDCKDKDK
jgi:hypothetical protein